MRFIFIFVFVFLCNILLYPQDLPPVKIDYASYAVSSDGSVIGYFGNQRRIEIKSTSRISKYITWCLLATEDRDFYNHDGVSYKGLIRGILKTITGSTQGGSTITMQLARNLFLSHEKSLGRKINEIDLARKLELRYSKNEILLLYLNTVYFGKGAHGIWAASQEYFSKTPDKLNVSESAVLVGLLQSPSGYDPEKNPAKLLSRRNEVLYNLVETGKLSEKEYRKLKAEPLKLSLRGNPARHFLEHIRKEAVNIISQRGLKLSEDQLKITTTLDYTLQEIAEKNIKNQWDAFNTSQKDLQVGLISIEPNTGYIKAMVGGNPESGSRDLNHTTQIKRQTGSSFKVFLYGTMIKNGFTLATPLLDSLIVVDRNKPTEWRPSNSDNKFSGKFLPMINAIQHSINLAAAYSITKITNPDSVISFARLCGIKSFIPSYPSIALGTAEVSPAEMAAGYSTIASFGIYTEPVSIMKIEDQNGHVIYNAIPQHQVVLDSADCFLITQALRTVVDSGTASSIRRYYSGPAAGKTGTTQNSADVWFVGYTPALTTAIWMGYDSPSRKLTGGLQYGGTACAPLWGKIMGQYSVNISKTKTVFSEPAGIEEIYLCMNSGERASEYCTSTRIFTINLLKIPNPCHLHSPREKFDIHYSF